MLLAKPIRASQQMAVYGIVTSVILWGVLFTSTAVEATDRPLTDNVCVIQLVGKSGAIKKSTKGVGALEHVSFNCTGTKLPVPIRVHPSVKEAAVLQEGVKLSTDDEVRGWIQFEDIRSLTILDSVFEGLVGGILAPVVFDKSAGLFYHCRFVKNSCAHSGGIYSAGGSLMHVYDSIFEENKGARYGAVSTTSGCRTLFINTTFFNNQGGPCDRDYDGFVSGAVFSFQNTLTEFERCQMKQNVADGAGAGAFTGVKRTVVRFTDCLIEKNSGESGALALIDISTGIVENTQIYRNKASVDGAAAFLDLRSHLTIQGSTLTENTGTSGAIVSYGGSELDVSQTMFTSNQGTVYGGAVSSLNGGSVLVDTCDFEWNSGAFGGAVYQERLKDTIFTKCLFSNNAAMHAGGALFQRDVKKTELTECTFTHNTGGSVGGAVMQTGCGTADWLSPRHQKQVSCAEDAVPTCEKIIIADCSFDENDAGQKGSSLFQDRCKTLVLTGTSFPEEEKAVVQSRCETREYTSVTATGTETIFVQDCPVKTSADRRLLVSSSN